MRKRRGSGVTCRKGRGDEVVRVMNWSARLVVPVIAATCACCAYFAVSDSSYPAGDRVVRASRVEVPSARVSTESTTRIRSSDWSMLARDGETLVRPPFRVHRLAAPARCVPAERCAITSIASADLCELQDLVHPVNGMIKAFSPVAQSCGVIDVFVVSSIVLDGDRCIAYNIDRSVFVAAPMGCDPSVGWTGVGRALIHEVSEVLLRVNPGKFDASEWRAALPPEFSYAGPDDDDACLGTADSSLLVLGFVTPYATRTLSDDFAETSAELFTRYHRLARRAQRSERIRSKMRLVMRFYAALSPEYTEQFFESRSSL